MTEWFRFHNLARVEDGLIGERHYLVDPGKRDVYVIGHIDGYGHNANAIRCFCCCVGAGRANVRSLLAGRC